MQVHLLTSYFIEVLYTLGFHLFADTSGKLLRNVYSSKVIALVTA